MGCLDGSRRGLTVVECAVMVCAAAAAFCSAAVLMGAGQQGGRRDAAIQDAMQVRRLAQALAIFATGNDEDFPLPSELDLMDTTVEAQGRAKDTSAQIFSLLIGVGSLRPVEFISPLEVNKSIEVDGDYALENPPTAPDPANALWDQAFSVDFRDKNKGNTSYAHLQPAGDRLRLRWMNTFDPLGAVIASRGPETLSTDQDARKAKDRITVADRGSNTNRFLRPRSTWTGHVAFQDGHVYEVSSQMPDVGVGSGAWPTYLRNDGVRRLDALFLDEADDPDDINAYLGLFVEAGEKPEDYEAIWD